MTASVIISTVALILSATMTVSVTVLVSRALSDAFRTLDGMHERNARHVDLLLDRLQAIKWEDYVTMQTYREAPEEGGFEGPEEPAPEEGSVSWGALRAAPSLEETLAQEDFVS